jgi:hypothetical protein
VFPLEGLRAGVRLILAAGIGAVAQQVGDVGFRFGDLTAQPIRLGFQQGSDLGKLSGRPRPFIRAGALSAVVG